MTRKFMSFYCSLVTTHPVRSQTLNRTFRNIHVTDVALPPRTDWPCASRRLAPFSRDLFPGQMHVPSPNINRRDRVHRLQRQPRIVLLHLLYLQPAIYSALPTTTSCKAFLTHRHTTSTSTTRSHPQTWLNQTQQSARGTSTCTLTSQYNIRHTNTLPASKQNSWTSCSTPPPASPPSPQMKTCPSGPPPSTAPLAHLTPP
jgi:hypothetical protein